MGRGANSSRIGVRHSGGEIIQVHGGHILRSIGRKDRHSKVCTSKGPKDRRVRLSAHTAIQFYDVQDRLGYDRPSKAVDWLIKKAKAAIDQLGELPAWIPSVNREKMTQEDEPEPEPEPEPEAEEEFVGDDGGGGVLAGGNNSGIFPTSMHGGNDDDPIQLFFPVGASSEANPSPLQFQNFHQPCSQNQDLRLSLQSFQHHHPILHPQLVFDPSSSSGWPEEHSSETGRFMFSTPRMLQPLLAQNQMFSQGGPLQSSNTQTLRGWMIDPSPSSLDHHHIHQSPFPGMGFPSAGGISGFGFPARVQGEEEQHHHHHRRRHRISNNPSSPASSDSHHNIID